MQFDRYSNRAAEVAADLVNACLPDRRGSAARPMDPSTVTTPPSTLEAVTVDAVTVDAVRSVLSDRAVPLRVEPADLPAILALADDLRGVFRAPDVAAAIDGLNRLLAVTPMAPRVSTHDGRDPHLHVEPESAPVPQRLRANCLMGLAAVLCDGGTHRLGVCDAHGCDRVYVDTTRNARRRFCSDTCGTRTHVAAHRARRARA
jgi:predicted RNA-binding Zn ribbon-like protein